MQKRLDVTMEKIIVTPDAVDPDSTTEQPTSQRPSALPAIPKSKKDNNNIGSKNCNKSNKSNIYDFTRCDKLFR